MRYKAGAVEWAYQDSTPPLRGGVRSAAKSRNQDLTGEDAKLSRCRGAGKLGVLTSDAGKRVGVRWRRRADMPGVDAAVNRPDEERCVQSTGETKTAQKTKPRLRCPPRSGEAVRPNV